MLDKINKYLNLSLIISGVMAILGVVLMVYPEVSFTIISYVIGISFLAAGVSLLFIERKFMFSLFNGALIFILGLLIVIHPELLKVMIPIIVGLWFIINGGLKFRLGTLFKDIDNKKYWLTIILASLSFVLGIVLVINPIESASALTLFFGIMLVSYSICDIVDFIVIKKYIKDFSKELNRFQREIFEVCEFNISGFSTTFNESIASDKALFNSSSYKTTSL